MDGYLDCKINLEIFMDENKGLIYLFTRAIEI